MSMSGIDAQDAVSAIPGAMPSLAEEVWVIQKYKGPAQPADPNVSRYGELQAKINDQLITVPLKHTDVKAQISAYIASVRVQQQYHNPYETKIEAIYVFPLPENAAVSEFVMTVGERRIRGIIRDREEATKIYQEAKSQGYVASLLTQERPNIFTQSVANIEPGRAIDIDICYFHTLAYDDGAYEFVFPMVVGPRFNPPGSTAGVGSVARGNRGASGQSTEVPYLKPGERSGHDISISVSIDAGVPIERIECRSHVVEVKNAGLGKAEVTLSQLDAIPNRDFVLRYEVAGKQIKTGLLTHRDARGDFFTLMVYPPADLASLERGPLELVFVLDCSGSMNGQPIEQAKAAIERALRQMKPHDTFQIIRFSNNASQLGPAPIPATTENVREGLSYLKSLNGEGGTMMIEGIKAALDFPHDPQRLRFVSFLTDGYIGNEAEIFAATHQRLRDSRIFSFGVGTSVNRYLLDGLARMGKGAVAYLNLTDSAADVMDRFFARIAHPAMTDVKLSWKAADEKSIYPQKLPDLFVGRPLVITGRYDRNRSGRIHILGQSAGRPHEITIPVNVSTSDEHDAIPAVWARMQIAELAARAAYEPMPQLPDQIRKVALDYGLMSAYTAFVAVDSLTRTAGDHGISVAIPVPVPDGVRYETTVQER